MKLIVLVGTPGSGKSTYCSKYPSYIQINQDILGNRYKCLELFHEALEYEQNVIVDRCNINKAQRLIWLKGAKKYDIDQITAIYLKVDPETCIKRINQRKDHPTIKDGEIYKNTKIVYNFANNLEIPTLEEGFNEVLVISNK